MCSLSVKPSVNLSSLDLSLACGGDCAQCQSLLNSTTLSNCNQSSKSSYQEYSVTIPQFWSRRADWTPGCSISANIEIGHQACQLHVYPAGKEWTDMDGYCVVNISTDTEDHEVLKDESTCTNEENIDYESDPKQIKFEASEGNRLCVELVNLTNCHLVIQGEWSVGFVTEDLKPVKLLSTNRVVILNVDTKEEERLQLIKTGEKPVENIGEDDDDLKIKLDFNVVSVTNPSLREMEQVTEVLLSNQLAISEVNKKVDEINPKLAELRDQFQAEMESMQDILLETPLSAEVSDMKAQVSQMKTEIVNQIKIDVNNKFQSLKESVLPTIYTELAAMKKDLTSTLGVMHQARNEQASEASAARQDIFTSVSSLKDNLQSTSSNSTRSAISELQVQLEMLQDSVLSAVSSPATQVKPSYPECPYCMEDLEPPSKIYQCMSGHLICESCQSKPSIMDCPSCHQQFCGRNRGLETFLQRLAGQ